MDNRKLILAAAIILVTMATVASQFLEQDYDYPYNPKPRSKQKGRDKKRGNNDEEVEDETDHGSLLEKLLTSPHAVLSNASDNRMFIDVGVRQDYLIQNCGGESMKYSFPNVDYALLGYNIIRGYPMSTGSDPGFTYPIFRADYSQRRHTADCRYSIPRGFLLLPDVSCEISFISTVAKSTMEFESSLAASAKVSAGGWGFQFSASAEYQSVSSDISSTEYVYIFSKASCNYYISKLQDGETPLFDPTFLKWLDKLNNANSDGVYIDFLAKYGTHYPTEIRFGSRYVQQHRMKSSEYTSRESRGVNVAVEAGYNGLISAGGGFSLDSSMKNSAFSFAKAVETTTITVGAAPPASGDATAWAASVQSNPVPASYQLDAIENLFIGEYMGSLGIDLDRIRAKIIENKFAYWNMLIRDKDADDFSFDLLDGILIPNWKVDSSFKDEQITFNDCLNTCKNVGSAHCSGVSYCKNCVDSSQSICAIFKKGRSMGKIEFDIKWQTILFNGELTLNGVTISDTSGTPTHTYVTAIGTDASKYAEAVHSCYDNAKKMSSTAYSCTYGMAFNEAMFLCKIFGNRRVMTLENKKGYTTIINAK